ncbi:MAG: hypothetical protein AAF519_13535, partial [Bacteroidota bacterium]
MLRHLILSTAALLVCATPASTQSVFHFSGPYTVGPYQGVANFDYRFEEGDTVLHGPFEMQQSDLSSLLNDRDDYFSCQGVFENNRPVGKWIFR